ncbi:Sec-independent protein translocase protein TatC [Nitrincola nitratireducens]|uniref:Sec-independent protein translocase protein TatC n=1 Tax=Nitrincola nitratireducens TaxID=1229521 RepID=W9V137_9GAMM|nr:Sec-independent protein translocase protein TatC [Nitrincola nitratireducens]
MSTEDKDQEQPLISHLVELRQRLMRSVLAVLLIFLALFYFANDLYLFVSAPLTALLPEGTSMIATDVTSPFFAPFKLALVVSLGLAMPIYCIRLGRLLHRVFIAMKRNWLSLYCYPALSCFMQGLRLRTLSCFR